MTGVVGYGWLDGYERDGSGDSREEIEEARSGDDETVTGARTWNESDDETS